jgi:nucleotide-binding universal stress UspA family protein
MPQIKKILFPVDFSESCIGAARFVEYFAGQFQAEITLLHAVSMGEHSLAEELLPKRKAELNAFLAQELKYFTTKRICIIEDPANAILETANSWQPDLLMLPTHGLGYFRRRLLGSVTAKSLHDLRCPIWTSVHAETTPALEAIHCRRILCAIDLTTHSQFVLEWAAWLAREYNATLRIVHATLPLTVSSEVWPMGDELQREVHERAVADVEKLKQRAGLNVQAVVNAGNPADVIEEAAGDFEADLVVVGRGHENGLTAAFFQHAYAILSQSPCPVISV